MAQNDMNAPGSNEQGAHAERPDQTVARHLRALSKDALAGLTGAIAGVPDGMAGGVLAGVNPLYGLYASVVGPIAGGALSSTVLLVVSTTSAASIATGEALAQSDAANRTEVLFLLTLLVGAAQLLAGILRLGGLTRFVSHSVMTGFLNGIAVLIVLGQLGNLMGYSPEGSNKVAQALDVIVHFRSIDVATLMTGLLTIVLVIALTRTPLRSVGTLVAIIVPSLLVVLLGWRSVGTVSALGAIPRGLPLPSIPSFSLISSDVLASALAIAVITLVQGAGVSQSNPNPNGRPNNLSRDFVAQGAANLAAGLFRGLPVGGSLSQTALNVTAGARTRWAAIFSGIWIGAILVAVPNLVSYVAIPALAGLLVVAGVRTVNLPETMSILRVGWLPRLAIAVTFVATLFLPIQFAVGLGVALSAVLHVVRASSDVRVVQMVETPDGHLEERQPPETLPSDTVTVLGIYGSLFYAGAWTLARSLPSPKQTSRPVVVLRLRGKTQVGATFIRVLSDYARSLHAVGGRLYLSGVDEHVLDQLRRSHTLHLIGPSQVYTATPVVNQSTRRAHAEAATWLISETEAETEAETPIGE